VICVPASRWVIAHQESAARRAQRHWRTRCNSQSAPLRTGLGRSGASPHQFMPLPPSSLPRLTSYHPSTRLTYTWTPASLKNCATLSAIAA
jgi:hypothetical protein